MPEIVKKEMFEPAQQNQAIGEDRIRVRAYELFEKRAPEAGDPVADWYRAEAELREESQSQPQLLQQPPQQQRSKGK